MNKERKLLLRALLPEKLSIELHKAEEGGYWAKTIEISCSAQGETLSELFDVLTKAVYAYFDAPEELISEFGSYLPVETVRARFKEQKPSRYTLDDILRGNPENIKDLQRIS